MAEVPIALIVMLLLNAASTEQIENSDKKYLEADSKVVEAKIRISHHSTPIKEKTSTTSNDDVSTRKDSELAQESVEQGRRRPIQENNYDFGYAVNDAFDGHQFRQEQMTDDGTVHGRFGYRDTKGMFRQVDYMADDFGFRANIKTNEPGTMDLDPANVDIDRMHYVDLKREHPPHYSKKPHQALKTSTIKKVGHEYDPDDSRDYQESYEHKSEDDDDEEENSQSSYHGSDGSSEDQGYQIPKKKGKAIIYQYFHKQHMAHHEENPHSFADNEHVEETPHHHQQLNHYDAPEKTSYEDSNETPHHLTLSRLPEPNHYELHAERVSPKHEVYDEEHKEFVKTPKYSKLLKEQPTYSHHGQHNIHEHDPKPRFPVENNYPVHDKDDRRRNKPIRHEHTRRNPNDRPYHDEIKATPYHGKPNLNQQNHHHTYAHHKHLTESAHARHPTNYHSTNNYAGNEHYGNINPRHHGQIHDLTHEAEVHHHGLVRDSTYRRPSRPVPQETTIEVREKQSHDETHKNRIRNKYVSSLKHKVEPKFPAKILYTPSHNSQIDSTVSYQGPIHKKYFREEIVYGFPVDKHIAKYDRHQADFPSYETVNETSSEEVQSLDYTRYPSSYSKPEATSHQKQKTYIIVHQKQVESQPNHKHQINVDKDVIYSQRESIPQLQNTKIGPKFAVLFDPSVFKHFEKFRISGRNEDESKWIPIIPQIKWLPRSTPPSTDWIPMPSSRVKRYH